MGKTANYNLPFPEATDKANVPLDIQKLAEAAEAALENKVNSEIGKRLMTNTEGEKLASLENYDDTELNKKIEEQAEQIAQLEKEKNQLLKDHKPIPFNSSSNHLEDTGELPMPISINSGIEQDSRIGYNLLDVRGFAVKETNAQVTCDVTENGELIINGTTGNGGNDIRLSSTEPIITLPVGDYIFDYKTSENTGEKFNTEINLTSVGLGTYLLIKKLAENISYKQFSVTENFDIYNINIHLKPNTTYTNYIIRPMIYSGTEEKPSEQYGQMPSLEFPSEVKGVSGHYDTVISNKNICPTDFNSWESGDYDINTGVKTAYETRIRLIELLPVNPNTEYYLNTFKENHFLIIREFDKNKTFIKSSGSISNGNVLTTSETTNYLGVSLWGLLTSPPSSDDLMNLIENGEIKPFICLNSETDKTFIEHQSQNLPIDIPIGKVLYNPDCIVELTDVEIEELGLEKAELYFKDEWYKEQITSSNVLGKTGYGTNAYNIKNSKYSRMTFSNLQNIYVLSNYFKGISYNERTNGIKDSIYAENRENIVIRDTPFTTGEELKTFLDSNEVYVVYQLETPIYTPIKDENFIKQYRALQKAQSYREITNINSYKSSEDVAEMKLSGNALMSNDIRLSKLENAIVSLGGISNV